MHWFAQVQGQIYGPYSDSHMQSYVAEGRLNAESLISNVPAEGFYPASTYDIFSFWAGTGQIGAHQAVGETAMGSTSMGSAANYQPTTPSEPYASPAVLTTPMTQVSQSVSPSYGLTHRGANSHSAGQDTLSNASPNAPVKELKIFMIMAEIQSEGLVAFLAALQDFGTAERVGDSVWLLKAPTSSDALRNSLSQALSRQDRMFIIDCTGNKTAWFNIGADLDSRIRNLWDDDRR